MTTSLIVSGHGNFKSTDSGSFKVVKSKTKVLVTDILANNANDYTQQNYPVSKLTPILFDPDNFIYEVDGNDPSVYDTTGWPFSGGTQSSFVEFTTIPNKKFFGTDNDKIDFKINWYNNQDKTIQIRLTNDSMYNTLTNNTYVAIYIEFNTPSSPHRIRWLDHLNTFISQNRVFMNDDCKNAIIASSSSGDPFIVRLTRLNNSQIRLNILDKNGNEFANPQPPATFNLSTTQFTPADPGTNDDSIFVGDITHMSIRGELSTHIDYTVEKL